MYIVSLGSREYVVAGDFQCVCSFAWQAEMLAKALAQTTQCYVKIRPAADKSADLPGKEPCAEDLYDFQNRVTQGWNRYMRERV